MKTTLCVITVSYNAASTIERTILSVAKNKEFISQYIVIDGASTDGTVDIIKKHKDWIDIFVSEPDEGIYYAMNKGLQLATAEYVCFLNADDYFAADFIKDLPNIKQFDWVVGSALCEDSHGNVKSLFLPAISSSGNIDPIFSGTFLPHQALICKLAIARKLQFDCSFKVAADYDFMVRMLQYTTSYLFFQRPIVHFQLGGFSDSEDQNNEIFAVQRKNFNFLIKNYLSSRAHIIRYFKLLLTRQSDRSFRFERKDIIWLMAKLPLPHAIKAFLRIRYKIIQTILSIGRQTI